MSGDTEETKRTHVASRIMIVGGGSGGHVTPLLAVATTLKHIAPGVRVSVVGQKNEDLTEIVDHESINDVFSISAGKFRRYHGESFISHLFDVKTVLLNFRDFFRFAVGTVEAYRLLGREKPDSILLKGGFVSVPVGLAARIRKVPYITHDSDAIPGLANRLTAKHAVYNTTALPAAIYPYDQNKTVQVGIPLRREFSEVSAEERAGFKEELGIKPTDPVIFSVGGGLGAQKLNVALATISHSLLSDYPDLEIIHLSGKKLLNDTNKLYHEQLNQELFNRVRIIDFHADLYQLSGAADVVITRGGATNIAEFAVQAKPCVVVPNPVLTGGQQLHNARVLADAEAALIVNEGDSAGLESAVRSLLDSAAKRADLGHKMHGMSYPDSAHKIATILLEIPE